MPCRRHPPLLYQTARLVGLLLVACAGWAAAAAGADETAEVPEYPITDDERDHWSFRPLHRPPLPEVSRQPWVRNPIDHFILARLDAKGVAPQGEADRATLIRRLSFNLTGLPPEPAEVDAFLEDPSADAYEQLVGRLLAAPAYGQHWAQHWLDLARFAETDGFEFDHVRPQAWRYRDWVIEALNRDLPYDQFLQLQLAGDELRPGNPQATVATAFCLSGPDMPDINSQDERRHHLLNEMTATVGAVFLGLQIGCAQCHHHKFDSISQADFYRLRAIFEPAVQVKANRSVDVLGEASGKLPATHVMLRGDWRRPGPPVQPAFPRIANPWGEEVPATGPDAETSGRRAALARWLTRPDHPLTSRVIANRLWQYHFGQGLSRTPSDFGVLGEEPSHPELLDWLATELVRQQWSLKQMHRLIVTSATYRQASRSNGPDNNDWLAHFPRRRLEGEAIRDAMLAASGLLSPRRGGPGVMPPLSKELLSTLLPNQWKVSPDREDHYRRSVYLMARRNLRYPLLEVFDRPDANSSCPQRSGSTTAPQSLLMLNSELSLTAARHLAGLAATHSADPHSQITLAFRRTLGRAPTAEEQQTSRQFLDHQQQLLVSEQRTADQLALPVPCPAEMPSTYAAALTDLCLALLNVSEFVYVD